MALAAAVGGAAFGRTRSLAISQRGHGHHLLQQNLKEVRQLRARAQDLAGETSCDAFLAALQLAIAVAGRVLVRRLLCLAWAVDRATLAPQHGNALPRRSTGLVLVA